LERIDGTDDDLPPPSGGNGFGSAPAKRKKRAKGDFRGLLLSNQTHRSVNGREARQFRKSGGTGAFLSYLGHCLMENRHGLVVASEVTAADGYGERAAALRMARSLPGTHQKTLAADKGYDTRDFVANIRFAGITPHVAQNIQSRRRSAIDGRTIRHAGYAQSINARKRIEQVFGWIKQAAGLRQLKGQKPIPGGSGVPVACGGLQPDPPGQTAQPEGGPGMKVVGTGRAAEIDPLGIDTDAMEDRRIGRASLPAGKPQGPKNPICSGGFWIGGYFSSLLITLGFCSFFGGLAKGALEFRVGPRRPAGEPGLPAAVL